MEITEERRRKLSEASSKKVAQLEMDGTLVRIWPNAVTAVKELRSLHVTSAGISGCIHGKYNTCGGFKWQKVYDENN